MCGFICAIDTFYKDLLAAVNFCLPSCDDEFELKNSKRRNAIHSLSAFFFFKHCRAILHMTQNLAHFVAV